MRKQSDVLFMGAGLLQTSMLAGVHLVVVAPQTATHPEEQHLLIRNPADVSTTCRAKPMSIHRIIAGGGRVSGDREGLFVF